jgi:hypothetical protein
MHINVHTISINVHTFHFASQRTHYPHGINFASQRTHTITCISTYTLSVSTYTLLPLPHNAHTIHMELTLPNNVHTLSHAYQRTHYQYQRTHFKLCLTTHTLFTCINTPSIRVRTRALCPTHPHLPHLVVGKTHCHVVHHTHVHSHHVAACVSVGVSVCNRGCECVHWY